MVDSALLTTLQCPTRLLLRAETSRLASVPDRTMTETCCGLVWMPWKKSKCDGDKRCIKPRDFTALSSRSSFSMTLGFVIDHQVGMAIGHGERPVPKHVGNFEKGRALLRRAWDAAVWRGSWE
ncbi:MAG: hypothetical protein ACYDAE_02400 [Steroidobacteraceae bacterium]